MTDRVPEAIEQFLGLKLNDEQRRFLTTVKRNSDRLMRLVGDLLLIGQMDAGRFTLDMTDVDVSELVSETVTLFEGTATEKRIELTADMMPGAMVRGDRLRLGQLLSNLVSNAVKFTPEGGQVRVRVGEQGGTCVVEVTDSGIGIPLEERSHLFERFYRASTATGTAGSGLGLAISKAIADLASIAEPASLARANTVLQRGLLRIRHQ